MVGGRVEVISSKGCSRLFAGSSSSFSTFSTTRSADMMSSASVPRSEPTAPLVSGPFTGLVICVTGLSKEARKQVMAATERLGGQYSATLHPQCTHLVVQSSSGRKLEHALKHGFKTGLSIVTLVWFVESVRRNVRLNESLYSIKSVGENSLPLTEFNQPGPLPGNEKSCLPVTVFGDGTSSDRTWQLQRLPEKNIKSGGSIFSNEYIYIDAEISNGLKEKIVEAANMEGATILDQWFAGCHATHVVCEGPSVHKYIGLTNNLVTPPWILKTVKEKCLQRLVHLSSDLARQLSLVLENAQIAGEDNYRQKPITLNSGKSLAHGKNKGSLEDRQKVVDSAKVGVRIRRSHCMQSCGVPILPITPSSLLESICWSISEPTSSARIYAESSWSEDASEKRSSDVVDATDAVRDSEALSGDTFSRALRESERREVILKGHFLTILFPVDRFGEIGPSSRTFFSDGGFTCQQILDYIYNFYQEYISADEIEVAIHTDSRHADRLRSLYASKESIDQGFVSLKRIDFVGSRRSFETLKRINVGNNNNVYELIIRA